MFIRINKGTKYERVIGFLDTDKMVFQKTIHKSKHLFKKFDAIGIDSNYFTDVLLPNNYDIQVWEKEENFIYEINAKQFKHNGFYFHFKEEKEDHHAQIFLSRRYWKKREAIEEKEKEDFFRYLV